VRHPEDEQRHGDPGDPRPELGEDLAAPEEVEVAIPAQRNRLGCRFF
jgi:hypothetical protein